MERSVLRILIISQYYPPEPLTLPGDLAEFFAREGHEVTVVTGHPNYPGGRYYKEVTSAFPRCVHENKVKVWRLPYFLDHSKSTLRRFVSYLSFTSLASLWAIFTCPRPHIVVCHQTPFTVGLGGLFFRYVRGSCLVLQYADLWPESLVASGLPARSLAVRAMHHFSRWINRRADLLIPMTRGMERRFLSDGIPAKKVHYAPYWFRHELAEEGAKGVVADLSEETAANDAIHIVYTGNLGPPQALGTILEAARILAQEDPRLHFDFYGIGHSEAALRAQAVELGLANVTFHGYIAKPLLARVLRRARAAIVHLANHESFAMTVPSKLYFYLANHVPLLVGVVGETAALARESQGAVLFEPENSASLVQACRQIAAWSPLDRDQVAERGYAFYRQHLEPGATLPLVGAAITSAYHGALNPHTEEA